MNREAKRKAKARQHINTTPLAQPPLAQEPPQPNIRHKLLVWRKAVYWLGEKSVWLFWNGVGLAGALALFFEFSPRIAVSPEQPIDPSDAFSAPFVIANDGYLSLRKISAICSLQDVQLGTFSIQGIAVMGSKTDFAADMLPGEKFTVKCRFRENVTTSDPLARADILIIIHYRLRLWPLERDRAFRFESVKTSDGSWRWLPQPVNK